MYYIFGIFLCADEYVCAACGRLACRSEEFFQEFYSLHSCVNHDDKESHRVFRQEGEYKVSAVAVYTWNAGGTV